jgi:hypothetical protein
VPDGPDMPETEPNTDATYNQLVERLLYRIVDAREVLVKGYEMPLSEADVAIAHACLRFIAGLETAAPNPAAFRRRLIALLDGECQRNKAIS